MKFEFLGFLVWPKDSLVLGGNRPKDSLVLTADSTLAPRSLLARSPQHQGVFWPNPKSQKLKFQVSFLGLNIALFPNLFGSSDVAFFNDSESDSEFTFGTKESFDQISVELAYEA